MGETDSDFSCIGSMTDDLLKSLFRLLPRCQEHSVTLEGVPQSALLLLYSYNNRDYLKEFDVVNFRDHFGFRGAAWHRILT